MIDYEEKAKKNLEKFNAFLAEDPRVDELDAMYDVFGEQLLSAPASGKIHYHNAFPGGYLDHVVHVAETSMKVATAYKAIGGEIDFTKQEMIFAALHHDLGKLGNETGPYYLDQDSDWHRKRGEMYTYNDNIQYMTVTDRALYLLQKFNIKVTEKEWLAIKMSDGLYDDGNKAYYKPFQKYAMKTNLPYVIHWSDHMACTAERDEGMF
jgi:hypothetical protein